MDAKTMRKKIFREMLDDGKRKKSVFRIYRIVWLIEECGYELEKIRRKKRWRAEEYSRHTLKLYFLRRELLKDQLTKGLPDFGKPVKEIL